MESAVIWMGDLDSSMDAAFVTEAFANVGFTAVEVKEIFHKTTGDRAHYCFVDFGDVNVAREVIIKVSNEPIPGTKGKKFRLNRSEYGRSSGGETEYSMFVGDITDDVTDNHLLDFFRTRYPSVRAAKVVKDDKGVSKGFGFVRFFNEEEHTRALKEMQGSKGLGRRAIRINKATKGKPQDAMQAGSNHNPISGMDPSVLPGWMQMQLNYMQQMQQYMQKCQQYAQQAAQSVGWSPLNSKVNQERDIESQFSLIQQQHEQMIAQTTDESEDQDLVDPNPPIDVVAMNQEIIDQDDRLFFELEASRWDPEMSIFAAHEQRLMKVR